MAKSPADRRRDRRIEARLMVRFRDRRNLGGEFIKNISYGGIFVCTRDPLPIGSNVELTLEGPKGNKTLKTKGTVVWASDEVTESVDDAPEKKSYGMGIRFKNVKKTLASIREFIDSLEESGT